MSNTGCMNCGHGNPADSKVCDKCGTPLFTRTATSPALKVLAALGALFAVIVVVVAILDDGHKTRVQPQTSTPPPSTEPSGAGSRGAETAIPDATPRTRWEYEQREDKMTGQTSYFAQITSTNTVDFAFPYSGDQHAKLLLRRKRGSDNVILIIEKGQFLCGYGGCSVTVRFDEKPPRRFSAAGPEDNSTTSLFINNERSFIAEAQKAKTIRIEAVVFQNGSPVFEFETAGLKWR
jgi:hypothetical protein